MKEHREGCAPTPYWAKNSWCPCGFEAFQAGVEACKPWKEALEAFRDSITFGDDWGAWFKSEQMPGAKSDRELMAILEAALALIPGGKT